MLTLVSLLVIYVIFIDNNLPQYSQVNTLFLTCFLYLLATEVSGDCTDTTRARNSSLLKIRPNTTTENTHAQ